MVNKKGAYAIDLVKNLSKRYIQQEFDYKLWTHQKTNYSEVDITDETRVDACTTLLVFEWKYHISGVSLELYDNTELAKLGSIRAILLV